MKTRNPWKLAFIVLASLIGFVLIVSVMFPMFSRARECAREYRPSMDRKEADSAGMELSAGMRAAWASTTPRMIISAADLNLEVRDVLKSHDEIAQIAKEADGFLTQSNVDGYGGDTASITLRVPAKNYQSVLAKVSKLGKVTSKNEKSDDVTEEYVDIQSRIRNLRREEEAFLKVLNRANKVTDILAVERELSRVRGEIEQATGRVKYLENQVALATIDVQLNEPTPAVSSIVNWNIFQTAKGAFNALQLIFRWIVSLLITVVVFIPLWLLIGSTVYGWKKYRRQ